MTILTNFCVQFYDFHVLDRFDEEFPAGLGELVRIVEQDREEEIRRREEEEARSDRMREKHDAFMQAEAEVWEEIEEVQ